jgi:hypothetical protein
MKKYRICWKSKITGEKGYGEWLPDKKTIEATLKHTKKTTPTHDHWIEEKEDG